MNRALALFFALAVLASTLTVSGVYVLAGPGWAMLAAASVLAGAAAMVRRGLIANG